MADFDVSCPGPSTPEASTLEAHRRRAMCRPMRPDFDSLSTPVGRGCLPRKPVLLRYYVTQTKQRGRREIHREKFSTFTTTTTKQKRTKTQEAECTQHERSRHTRKQTPNALLPHHSHSYVCTRYYCGGTESPGGWVGGEQEQATENKMTPASYMEVGIAIRKQPTSR